MALGVVLTGLVLACVAEVIVMDRCCCHCRHEDGLFGVAVKYIAAHVALGTTSSVDAV